MAEITGREIQVHKLMRLWEDSVAGQLNFAFISGEAGVGKSFLLNHFLRQLKEKSQDTLTAGGFCSSMARSQQEPYLPFLQILESIVVHNKKRNFDKFRRGIVELAPEWIQILPGGGVVSAVWKTLTWGAKEIGSEGKDVNRRIIQYGEALKFASKNKPLLLWIEDLHWADDATLDLLSFISQHLMQCKIMFVLTYRQTDLISVGKQVHPLKELISKLSRQGSNFLEIELSNFDKGQAYEYFEKTQHKLMPEFAFHIWQKSGGNPLFLREYIALLHQLGYFIRRDGKFELKEKVAGNIKIPPTIEAIIEQKLNLLEDDYKKILGSASVLGDRFDIKTLALLIGIKEVSLAERLSALSDEYNLIKELDYQDGGEFQFTHATVQQYLYNKMGKTQRKVKHHEIANIIENNREGGEKIYDLAYHYDMGGNYEKAIEYYSKSAKIAINILAVDNSIFYGERIIILSKKVSPSRGKETQIAGLLVLAEAYFLLANYKKAINVCELGKELCASMEMNLSHSKFLYWEAMTYYHLNQRLKSFDFLKAAYQTLKSGNQNPEPEYEGMLLVRFGVYTHILESEVGLNSINRAIKISEEHNLPNLKLHALIVKAVLSDHLGNFSDVLEFSTEALLLAEKNNVLEAQATSHNLISKACRNQNKKEEAFYHLQKAAEISRKGGLPFRLHWILGRLAISWWEIKENPSEGLKLINDAIEISKQYSFPVNFDVALCWFILSFNLGNWDNAVKSMHIFNDSSGDLAREQGTYYLANGHLAFAFGEYEKAIDNYKASLEKNNQLVDNERDIQRIRPFLGISLLMQGDLSNGYVELLTSEKYWRDKRDALRYARCLRGLALYFSKIDIFKSEELLKRASKLTSNTFACDGWAEDASVQINLAQVLFQSNKIEEALIVGVGIYTRLKKWSHFLLGDAAILLSEVYKRKNDIFLSKRYEEEAVSDWKRLGIDRKEINDNRRIA